MVTYSQVEFIYGAYCLYRASRPLRKGRSAYRRPMSTDFETMALHEPGVVYFTEYLSVSFQLTYLDELYGEHNGTARACVNRGYQALFSEHLGMKLGKLIESQPCIHRTFARLKDRRDVKGIVVRTLDFVIKAPPSPYYNSSIRTFT